MFVCNQGTTIHVFRKIPLKDTIYILNTINFISKRIFVNFARLVLID